MKKKLIWSALLASFFLTSCQAGGSPTLDRAAPFNRFVGEYTSSNAVKDAEKVLNGQIAEDGFVLLKNLDGALPFNNSVTNISLFGKSSNGLVWNGGGSGSGSPDSSRNISLQDSLKKAGFEVNPTLVNFYSSSASGSGRSTPTSYDGTAYNTVGETPLSSYTDAIKESFNDYGDAAIIVISRSGTEGADCKTCDARDFDSDPFSERHYLQLSKNEEDMFNMVKEHFDNIVVLINSGNVFQCDQFENDDKVVGVLWIGTPGTYGCIAVGEILRGTVNPSGRTVDTWARDFTKDPTFQNFSDNAQTNLIEEEDSDGEMKKAYIANDTMLDPEGKPMFSYGTDKSYTDKEHPHWEGDGSKWGINKFPGGTATGEKYKVVKGGINGVKPASYVSYEEGVYVDYRYYETRYADLAAKKQKKADDWYKSEEGVIYPFGYGLSYTKFEQEIIEMNYEENAILNENCKTIEVKVRVSNTGTVAGKEVVQLYWKAPYKKGGIEKADHVLCAFAKTKLIPAGESEDVSLSFYLQDVANYDYTDANKNGFKGYELDGGNYRLLLAKNAHEFFGFKKFKVQADGIQYENDRYTGHKVENRFTDRGFYNSLPSEDGVEFTHMSRADFVKTFPKHPSMEDRTVKEGCRAEEFLTHEFSLYDIDGADSTYEYVPQAAYKSKADIEALGWSQRNTAMSSSQRMQLSEMRNVPMDDPKWVTFLNQFTYAELQKFVQDGTFHNPGMSEIGKTQTSDSDGPNIFNRGFLWAGEPIVAATYDIDIAMRRGELVGMEAQAGSSTYGWLGPACNTHRSPFGGRNFEYFSADPFLMGKICARIVAGATEKGVYCYFKHFAVNDQEKGREGVSTFVSEQALREIYLKPFQMAMQEGKATGVMSSYNRLGLMETAASYPLLTEVTREEWGFKGAVLSDMTHSGNGKINFKCYENINWRCIAGCNAQLDNSQFTSYIDAKWDNNRGCPTFKYDGDTYESYTWWYAVRTCAKEELWMSGNCGVYESLTVATDKIVADSRYELRVGEAANINMTVNGEGTLSIDAATPLPEGLSFENGALSGTPSKDCITRINVLLTNGNTVNGKIVELVIKPANGEAGGKDPGEEKSGKGGCGGEISAVSAIAMTSLLGLAIAGILAVRSYRKKEKDN